MPSRTRLVLVAAIAVGVLAVAGTAGLRAEDNASRRPTAQPTDATGNTYYIDPAEGADANLGTTDAPWRTINRARPGQGNPSVRPGDTVILRAGDYGKWIWRGVRNDDWVTYQAAPGAEVVFGETVWHDCTHIRLRGLRFVCRGFGTVADRHGYGVVLVNCDHLEMNACTVKGAMTSDWYGAGIKMMRSGEDGACRHITIRNTEIHDCTTCFGFSRVDHLLLENCHIHHASNDLISGADLTNSAITQCHIHDAKPQYEFRLEDAGDTVQGEFRKGERVVQDVTGASGTVLRATRRSGHLRLYLDVDHYSYEEPGGFYAFSTRKLSDVEFRGKGLNDFQHGGDAWRLDRWWKVEIDGTGGPADTFRMQWSRNKGKTWTTIGSQIPITGGSQDLCKQWRLKGRFGATRGHTLGDAWVFHTAGYHLVRGKQSGARMTPSTEGQAGHADAIQIYAYPGYPRHNENVTISRNVISKDAGQGVFLKQMKNVLIENNLIYGGFTSHTVAVQTGSVSATIRNNTIVTRRSSAITLYGNYYPWARARQYGTATNVIGGAGSDHVYSLVRPHTSSDANKPGAGDDWKRFWKDITDEMTFEVCNNICTTTATIDDDFGKSMTLRNNVVARFWTHKSLPLPGKSNHVFGASSLSEEQLAALFAAHRANDYRLKEGAVAIDCGDPAHAPAVDLLGRLRADGKPDAGCYEFGAPRRHPEHRNTYPADNQ